MNYYTITFLSLLGVSFIPYIILTIKKLSLQSKIIEGFHIPLLGAAAISFLMDFFPDSLHSSTLLTIIFFLFSVGNILKQFDKNMFYILSQLFFLSGLLLLCHLFGSIFLFQHTVRWTLITILIAVIIAYIVIIIICKKQKITSYLCTIIPIALSAFSIYESVFSLIFYKDLASILLVCSTVLGFGYVIFEVIDRLKLKFRFAKPVLNFWLLIILALIAASTILMIIL